MLALAPDRRVLPAEEARDTLRLAKGTGGRKFVAPLLRDRLFRDALDDAAAELELAALAGAADAVSDLLHAGVEPRGGFRRLLRGAAQGGHAGALRVLLADARVTAGDVRGLMWWAARFGSEDTVRLLLLDDRCDPAYDDNCALRAAARGPFPDIVKLLLEDARVAAAGGGGVIVSLAVRYHWPVDELRSLMASTGANPGADDSIALLDAVSDEVKPEVVDVLLADPRVDPSARGNAALRTAAQLGNGRVVGALLAHPRLRPDGAAGEFVLGYADVSLSWALAADPRTFVVAVAE